MGRHYVDYAGPTVIGGIMGHCFDCSCTHYASMVLATWPMKPTWPNDTQ